MHKTRKEISSLNDLFNDFKEMESDSKSSEATAINLTKEEIIEAAMRLLDEGYEFEMVEQDIGNGEKDIFISFNKKAS